MEPWPPDVRQFVQDAQEKAYRRLAVALGVGSDPAQAFARFNPGLPPFDLIAPKRSEAAMQMISAEKDQEHFNNSAAAFYERYAAVRPPTAYEPASSYAILLMTYDALQGLWETPEIRKPCLASIASGDLNACITIEASTQTPIIFFEQGLMRFLRDFALLIAWATPPLAPEDMTDARLARMPQKYQMPFVASGSFVGSISAYVLDGTPISNPTPIPSPEHNLFVASMMTTFMERFVMAHELAHLALGHLHRDPTMEQEFEADARALVTLSALSRASGLSWGMSMWACDLALSCLHILDHAISVVVFGGNKPGWKSPTHPDFYSRRLRLRNSLGTLVPDAPAEGLRTLRTLIAMSDATLQRLWEFCLAPLLMAYQAGKRPSPLWNDRIRECFRAPEGSIR